MMVKEQFITGNKVYNRNINFDNWEVQFMHEKEFAAEEILLVFGINIKKARLSRKMTVVELSQKAHYDRICLSNIESGKQNVKLHTAIKLAHALDVPFASLLSRNYMSLSTEQNSDSNCGYIEDDHLGIFIENFKRGLKEQRKNQLAVYTETWVSESVVSRIMTGKSKNPTLITLNSLAFITNKELALLFVRMN